MQVSTTSDLRVKNVYEDSFQHEAGAVEVHAPADLQARSRLVSGLQHVPHAPFASGGPNSSSPNAVTHKGWVETRLVALRAIFKLRNGCLHQRTCKR